MKQPSQEKSEIYHLNDKQFAVVHLTESGKFKVVIKNKEIVLFGEKPIISVEDDTSFEFDSFEEVEEYLLEIADEDYKSTFSG